MTPLLTRTVALAVDDELLDFYRTLHEHPELSGKEAETSNRLADALEAAGYAVHRGIGGHGIAAVLEDGAGPTLLVRADMDALPVEEATGLPYASRATGTDPNGNEVPVMHACGHDLHMAALVGFARAMQALRGSWRGRLVLIGQPSEERVSGAAAMITDGLYERIGRPDFAIALHAMPGYAEGTILFAEGTASAGSETIDLLVRGLGGHAAHPHETRDPVLLAAECVVAFQAIVGRELDPLAFGVVTVAMIHGGVKHNAIPDEVRLGIDIRFFDDNVRVQLLSAIERIATGLARAAGVPEDRLPVLTILDQGARPLVNDPALVRRVRDAVGAALGQERVESRGPSSGSEDFGAFGTADPPVPLCYFSVGCGSGHLHTSTYAPDPKPVLEAGVAAFAAAALELLGKD